MITILMTTAELILTRCRFTWNFQMTSVLSIAQEFSVEHVNTASVKFLEHQDVENAQTSCSLHYYQQLLLEAPMILNLTVSEGSVNGLIFYANIIRAVNLSSFHQRSTLHSLVHAFIAWLNLDLGIETCFYNGLGAYAKTWLQFVFPLYIWLMVITIIVASHYSTTVSRLTPNNALQVLATLFLLSYAKILRVVITVFSSTILL